MGKCIICNNETQNLYEYYKADIVSNEEWRGMIKYGGIEERKDYLCSCHSLRFLGDMYDPPYAVVDVNRRVNYIQPIIISIIYISVLLYTIVKGFDTFSIVVIIGITIFNIFLWKYTLTSNNVIKNDVLLSNGSEMIVLFLNHENEKKLHKDKKYYTAEELSNLAKENSEIDAFRKSQFK